MSSFCEAILYIVLQPNGQNLSLFLFLCVSVSQKTWPLRWNWVTPWENIWAGNWVIYWCRPWISCSGSDTPTAASFSTEISFFSRCRCGRLSWFYNWSQLEGKSKKTACRGEDWYWTLLISQPSEVKVKFHSVTRLFPTFVQSRLCWLNHQLYKEMYDGL